MGASRESQTSLATRRSIAKNFPLGKIMSRGCDNPITLHSADDQLFVRIWSVIAETLCVTVELSRTTKEAVATKVSESNSCPVCITAHTMMSVVSITVDTEQKKEKNSSEEEEREAKQHEQALEYADILLGEMKSEACGRNSASSSHFTNSSGSVSSGSKKNRKNRKFSHLSKTAKAEVALVVMLFNHMNRVVSVIMGEEMSSAMFSVPRSMARAMEKPSAIKLMSKLMSPLLSSSFKTKHKPGMTLSLFPEEEDQQQQKGKTASSLPKKLQGVLLAGVERANAVGRLVDWVKTYEKDNLISGGILSKDMIKFLERETKLNQSQACNFTTPGQVLKWVEGSFCDEISTEMEELELGETGKAIVMVLFLATFAPQTAYQSSHWTTLVDQVGTNTARSIVAWWSLRSTLRDAKGLDTAIDANTMVQILSVAWAA